MRRYGVGPGAVRFISGTWAPHVKLEARLAAFHGREAGMLFSSAYATVMGVLSPLITDKTAVISDALNHNSIINAISLSRPAEKRIYRPPRLRRAGRAARGAVEDLRARRRRHGRRLQHARRPRRPRQDHADRRQARSAASPRTSSSSPTTRTASAASAPRGRGTEEVVGGAKVDVLIGTLGKAFGVNGGYVVAGEPIIAYLRETSPFYIYSNPITPGEARSGARRRRSRRQRGGARRCSPTCAP